MEPRPTIKFKLNGVLRSGAEIDDLELQACYRALDNLRSLLFQAPMLDLLREQIKEGDRYFESLIRASRGKFRECRTFMKVAGVSATELRTLCNRWQLSKPLEDMARRIVFPTHPENYAIMHSPGAPVRSGPDCGVEVIGDHMAKVRFVDLMVSGEIPRWMSAQRDDSYEMAEYLVAKLESGSKFFYIMNEFMDTEGGCRIKLRAFFPSASPWSLINQHAEHLAVEFRNLLRIVHETLEELEDSY
ncbi:hypothetical protein DTO013E5_6113 [Penicillium roqueforti]|uniref:Uncharacterized protein n=1 Tax=Penicillium roqueforti (strain FM164) TaxID=1365484 RepID=W6Q673_PENRF|nr:hypothetical protein CBS147354_7724 [Penicillium roqueforti]CDM29754.1 hypothetical protein PROQFM164_S01g003567 [Penicillium roqueforti FM164]KAI2737093.1 hypothetical protein DTO012A1_7963 [Penicillium roqueforti]KAI2740276.1 hypothetical protein DTO013F2_9095 [Penicillium roqueforti]KAI2766613.1 hypothetical protein DTO012A8_8178 [Penicillium roqueforti]